MPVNPKRVRALAQEMPSKGPVIYWMSRDQRVKDNWALLYAREKAEELHSQLGVLFCLAPEFLGATARQYSFMIRGLQEVEQDLGTLNIPFFLLQGDPAKEIVRFCSDYDAGLLISDFSPLRKGRNWRNKVADRIGIAFYEVDAHNIVPCWIASPKAEWAAYSFRPKIHRLLSEFLEEFMPVKKCTATWIDWWENDWTVAEKGIIADPLADAKWLKPGEAAAAAALGHFVSHKLSSYDKERNDPTVDGQSNLSPYLHYGQIASQRTALQAIAGMSDAGPFLEELIVRKELADNFCYYNPHYDDFQGFPAWARATLQEHATDRREYLYRREELEASETHDELWNAAQKEMVARGKMHGYLRMYWAKKILEWSKTPQQALQSAIYLNDRYELDGRDPCGYAGIAWSIGGVHDRAWKERTIFGKVRYMSYNGARSKFNVKSYIKYVENLGR
jgi:deoxyribodipyrimidine photo-lyase